MIEKRKPFIIFALEERGVQFYHTGSQEIMENPPADSDDDWVVLGCAGTTAILEEHGLKPMGGENASGGSNTVPWYNKNKSLNIILTYEKETFNRWVAATKEAKRLKLNDRAERVALFKRYRVDDDPTIEEISI